MFSVTYEKKLNITIVRLLGKLTSDTVEKIKNDFERDFDKTRNYVFDLEFLEFIDSTGLGFIIQCLKKTLENEKQIKLLRLNNQPKIIFEITRVESLFEIYEDEVVALNDFKSEGTYDESTHTTLQQTA